MAHCEAPDVGRVGVDRGRTCGWLSCGWLCRDGGARLDEIDELAFQAELVEVAAGRLDPSGVGDAARRLSFVECPHHLTVLVGGDRVRGVNDDLAAG
jgi:hypothetical protein